MLQETRLCNYDAAEAICGLNLFDAMGGVAATQSFYRYYVFPNATHCGGAGMTEGVLLGALTSWVENGVAPDYLVAQVNPTRTRGPISARAVARDDAFAQRRDRRRYLARQGACTAWALSVTPSLAYCSVPSHSSTAGFASAESVAGPAGAPSATTHCADRPAWYMSPQPGEMP